MATNDKVITCATPDFSTVEKFGVLFGHPIAHSYSPLMHQTVYDNINYKWRQFLLESTDMSQFLDIMRYPDFYGKPHHKLKFNAHFQHSDRCRCHNASQG
jgi:quinate dehydrogenase